MNDDDPGLGGEADYYDGGHVEDYEDSTRARRPSDHGGTRYDQERIDLAIDLMIVRFRKIRVPWRAIATILNRPLASIHDRYSAIPAAKRSFYERAEGLL